METTLPDTLNGITDTKIRELEFQKKAFDERWQQLSAAMSSKDGIDGTVAELLSGIAKHEGYSVEELEKTALGNGLKYLKQYKYDPSLADEKMRQVKAQLVDYFDKIGAKNEHALFFSRLLTDWLEEAKVEQTPSENAAQGRQAMHDQRQTWESIVFTKNEVDVAEINTYLKTLFQESSAAAKIELATLQKNVKEYCTTIAEDTLSNTRLKKVGSKLLKNGQLSVSKMNTLKDILNNNSILGEVCDVLNMRLAHLENWDWSQDVIPLEMRRQLNGKYRVYMDADLLDALLLHYIGTKWAIFFKSQFTRFYSSDAWASVDGDTRKPTPTDLLKRKFYLGQENKESIEKRREKNHRKYFMNSLPDDFRGTANADGYNVSMSSEISGESPHYWIVQLMMTESIIHQTIHGEFSAVRSDFRWFGPSLSLDSINAVLKFFGVSDFWLDLFTRFLTVPVQFPGDEMPRRRQSGVPMNHTLSDLFGEAILFCMDYAVTVYGKGAELYRLHDDFWLWGRGDVVADAWGVVTDFTEKFGLQLNDDKTGSVQLGPPNKRDLLPNGKIVWGLLVFDEVQRRFIFDENLIKTHIEEFKLQLDSRQSIFGWIKAYNSYIGFLLRQSGTPSRCLGRDHFDMLLRTISRIEKEIFPTHGSCVKHLKSMIREKFNVEELPDGFLYFPSDFGGLELNNPYVKLQSREEGLEITVEQMIDDALTREKRNYEQQKRFFENSGGHDSLATREDVDADNFMTFSDYTKFREQKDTGFGVLYEDLLRPPKFSSVVSTRKFDEDLEIEDHEYWQWIRELYGDSVVEKFGSLSMVDSDKIPLGVFKLLNSGKVKWKA